MKNSKHEIGSTVYLNPNSKWATNDVTNPCNVKGEVINLGLPKDYKWTHVFWGEPVNIQNTYVKSESDLLTEQEYMDLVKQG